ncbi:hypothetical protein Tco_0294671 [Tanacetum coccineum]
MSSPGPSSGLSYSHISFFLGDWLLLSLDGLSVSLPLVLSLDALTIKTCGSLDPSFALYAKLNCHPETMEEMHENIINKVPNLTVLKTNELIEEALPRLVINVVKQERKSSRAAVSGLGSKEFVENAPKIIEELFRIHMQDTVLNVYPTTSASTSTTTTYDLQHQLYLKMKTDLPSQVADPELWEILRAKFEKSSTSTGPCQTDAFRKRYHDDHHEDDTPCNTPK